LLEQQKNGKTKSKRKKKKNEREREMFKKCVGGGGRKEEEKTLPRYVTRGGGKVPRKSSLVYVSSMSEVLN
jgi:hypothetical protein